MSKQLLLLFALLFALLGNTLLGSIPIYPSELWDWFVGGGDPMIREILINYRLPKTLTALLVGGALAVAGVLMQTLFRNPLAGPDVLGVNAGAGLGVAVMALLSTGGTIGFSVGNWGYMGASFVGAISVLVGVLFLSTKMNNNVALLIAGIMFGNLASALVSIIQNISNPDAIKLFVVWTFGSLNGVSWSMLGVMAPLILIGGVLCLLLRKGLNALLLGEYYARGIGIDVFRLRIIIVLLTALLAGTATVFAGPIGFIGITVPHLARWTVGSGEHGKILPMAFILGSLLLLVCDTIAQLPGYSGTLPINAVTALFGAPLVVYILFRNPSNLP